MIPSVRELSSADAKSALDVSGCFDPTFCQSNSEITKNGFCVEYESENGKVVCVMRGNGPRLWITGAASVGTKNIAQTSLPLVEKAALNMGYEIVSFQTGRKGLVKIALKQGYKVVGYIVEKVL